MEEKIPDPTEYPLQPPIAEAIKAKAKAFISEIGELESQGKIINPRVVVYGSVLIDYLKPPKDLDMFLIYDEIKDNPLEDSELLRQIKSQMWVLRLSGPAEAHEFEGIQVTPASIRSLTERLRADPETDRLIAGESIKSFSEKYPNLPLTRLVNYLEECIRFYPDDPTNEATIAKTNQQITSTESEAINEIEAGLLNWCRENGAQIGVEKLDYTSASPKQRKIHIHEILNVFIHTATRLYGNVKFGRFMNSYLSGTNFTQEVFRDPTTTIVYGENISIEGSQLILKRDESLLD